VEGEEIKYEWGKERVKKRKKNDKGSKYKINNSSLNFNHFFTSL
jgi:hypothetical protein